MYSFDFDAESETKFSTLLSIKSKMDRSRLSRDDLRKILLRIDSDYEEREVDLILDGKIFSYSTDELENILDALDTAVDIQRVNSDLGFDAVLDRMEDVIRSRKPQSGP